MSKQTEEKLKRILEINAEIERLKRELDDILAPESKVILPNNFSVIDEVLKLIKESSDPLGAPELARLLQSKYPSYGIDRKRVASALAYLKNKKKTIESVGRSAYKAVQETPAVESGGSG